MLANKLIANSGGSNRAGWVFCKGSSGDDFSNGITVDSDGNVYTTGSVKRVDHETNLVMDTAILIKQDSSGNVLWQKSLADYPVYSSTLFASGFPGCKTLFYDVCVDNATKDVYVVGEYSFPAQYPNHFYGVVVKFNSSGVKIADIILQDTTSATTRYAVPSCICMDSDYVYVGINEKNPTTNTIHIVVSKFPKSLNAQVWSTRIGGYNNYQSEIVNGIDVLSDGSVAITGQSSTTINNQIYVARLSSSGTVLWNSCTGVGTGNKVKVDANNNIYVVGAVFYSTQIRCYLAKYRSDGVNLWYTTLNHQSVNPATYSSLTSLSIQSNYVYISGVVNPSGAGIYYPVFAKCDASGNVMWQRRLTNESGLSKIVADSKNIYLACVKNNAYVSTNSNDIFVLKADSNSPKMGGFGVDGGTNLAAVGIQSYNLNNLNTIGLYAQYKTIPSTSPSASYWTTSATKGFYTGIISWLGGDYQEFSTVFSKASM